LNQTVVQPIFEANFSPPVPTKGEQEYLAFLRLLPELLTTHCGKHVAVHLGQVVDCDTDDIALVQRVHARFGYVPIHVGLVTDSQPIVRVPHYRALRGREQHS
jgi:hypothetical protein